MRICNTPLRALAALYLLHVAATSSSTSAITLYSTTTVATTTTTVTLSGNSNSHTNSDSHFSFSPTTTTMASTSTSPAAVAAPSIQSLNAQILNSTNYYRKNFLADPLTWNDTLANYATKWAKGCIWKHSGGPYGENLAEGFQSSTLAVDAWADEEAIYNYAKQKFGETTGHFTQLVWQATTSVGCGLIQCDNSGVQGGVQGAYLVCEYSPRGNVVGEYVGNVKKPGMGADGELGFGSGAAGAGRKSGVKKSMAALVVAWVFVVGFY